MPARPTPRDPPTPLLGGRTARAFLARHWQREALLVRGAVPGFTGMLGRKALLTLAGRDDVESRLVVRDGARYTLEHGPFRPGDFRGLPERNWTLLVQGVNLHDDDADALLRRFSFIPYARLDDVMVSYAVPGGGVGPHFDSYDVFLLQGMGRRRWRYGRQRDLSLRPNLPVKILRHFTPEHDEVLTGGDMLYLPPSQAHDGIALDECTTYSIGFRAAANVELAQAFLDHLRDRVDLPGRYADPGIAPATEPARVTDRLHQHATATLARLTWNPAEVARFLGAMLSEPKPDVYFDAPDAPLTARAFAAAIGRQGLRLDRRTQWLYDDDSMYVNGEARAWPRAGRALAATLANARALPAAQCRKMPPALLASLYADYRDGYLTPA